MNPTRSQTKIQQEADTAADVAAFLRNGGKVQVIPTGQANSAPTFRLFICTSCGSGTDRVQGKNICQTCRNAEETVRRAKRKSEQSMTARETI